MIGFFNDPEVGYVQAPQNYYNQDASFIARGAAEETYAYYSSTQMFCYAMNYPVVTGCHNTHRVTALKEVNGFPAHDADDLLITMLYRSAGWLGVYVPKVLAKGLTPVDWNGYLKQQLRWARSVLDIKFRIYPKIAGTLSFKERVIGYLHGLYYLQGATSFLVLLLITYMLATGYVPTAVNYLTLWNLAVLFVVTLLCDFYRQRFYLDRRNEWGLHWRAGLLQLAKWPYLVYALYQVGLNRRFPYVITSKVREEPTPYKLLWPHIAMGALICLAWVFGLIMGHSLNPLLQIFAAAIVLGIVLLTATGHMRFPAPYDLLSKKD